VRHPSEAVRKGDDLEVVVLEIDSSKRRISLGMKQTRENPWNELAKEFSIGIELRGKITRLLDRGAVVELKEDVEGFVPLSHLGIDNLRKPSDHFDVGMDIPLKVIKIDPQNKRIVLSVSAYLENKSPDEIDAFRNKFPKRETADLDRSAAKQGKEEQAGEPADYDIDEAYEDDIDAADGDPTAGPGPEGTGPTTG
jgi:small subunit ribosomal protein S1